MPPLPALRRVEERPNPDQWKDEELVTLAEAVALFFPRGPLHSGSLRIAIDRGELAGRSMCGRIYTTPGEIRRLLRLEKSAVPEVPSSTDAERIAARIEASKRDAASRRTPGRVDATVEPRAAVKGHRQPVRRKPL